MLICRKIVFRALRLNTVNIGVESLLQGYKKNEDEARQHKVIQGMLNDFKSGFDPEAYEGDIAEVIEKFSAELYYNLVFRHMDLFHPFVII